MKSLPVRKIVLAVLLVAILLVAWWFVLRPNQAKNKAMLAEIEAKQAKLREIDQATALMGDLEKEIHTLEESIAYFQSKLPSEKEVDKVLQEIWKLAEANHLTTKSIRTLQRGGGQESNPTPQQASEQPITVQLEGDFMGFYSFLLALEDQPRIMRINKMVLKKPDKADEGIVRAEFIMSIFFDRSTS